MFCPVNCIIFSSFWIYGYPHLTSEFNSFSRLWEFFYSSESREHYCTLVLASPFPNSLNIFVTKDKTRAPKKTVIRQEFIFLAKCLLAQLLQHISDFANLQSECAQTPSKLIWHNLLIHIDQLWNQYLSIPASNNKADPLATRTHL